MNWPNPIKTAVHHYASELLGDRYPKHAGFADRIAANLVTEEDLKNFSSMIADLYECGYLRAVNEYRGHLERMGYQVSVGPPR